MRGGARAVALPVLEKRIRVLFRAHRGEREEGLHFLAYGFSTCSSSAAVAATPMELATKFSSRAHATEALRAMGHLVERFAESSPADRNENGRGSLRCGVFFFLEDGLLSKAEIANSEGGCAPGLGALHEELLEVRDGPSFALGGESLACAIGASSAGRTSNDCRLSSHAWPVLEARAAGAASVSSRQQQQRGSGGEFGSEDEFGDRSSSSSL